MTVEEILAALQAIIDEADAAGGELSDAQVARYEELETQLKIRQKTEELRTRHEGYTKPATAKVTPGHVSTKKDDTLVRAFDSYLRTGIANQDITHLRAQSEGTNSAGGYIVPDEFRQKLVERRKAFGGIGNVAESFSTGDGRPVEWPTLDDTANSATIVAENAAPASGGADLVFGTATLGAYKYVATGAGNTPLKVSNELLQDAAFDVQGLVARKLGERIARAQAPDLVSGSGSSEPKGIVTGRTPVELNGGLTYANLLSVVHSVDPAYRESNCRWAFNDSTLQALRGVVDGNGRPLLIDANAGIEGSPGGLTLLGYPVTIDQAFPTFNATDDTVLAGVFGDLREGYVVRNVKDVTVFVDPYTAAGNGQVAFHAWARMDATQQNTAAYSVFSGFTA